MENVEQSKEEQNLERILSSEEATLGKTENAKIAIETPDSTLEEISKKLEEIDSLPKPQMDAIGVGLSDKIETSFDFPPKQEKSGLLDGVKKWTKRFLVTTAFTASSLTGFAKGGEKEPTDKTKKVGTENVTAARKISTTDLSPEYTSIGKDGQKEFFKTTKKITLEMAKPGTGNEDPKKYENWIKMQLANGISPQELADKKYIHNEEIGKYTEFYKPATDVVYIESDRGTTVPFNTGLETGMKQPNLELKERPPLRQEINKSYIINVRGDEHGGAGTYYVAQDEHRLREIQTLLTGGFSSAEYGGTYGQVTVDMSSKVLLSNWMNTPEKQALLGHMWHRDPKNPEYIIEDVSSTTNTTDLAKN